jgi:uncharacterized protein involved in exopolysaccharide biosynthesis
MNHVRQQQDVRSDARIERFQDQPGEAELRQLKELYLALRRNLGLIFVLAFCAAAAAYTASLFIEEKYSATAKVMLKTRVAVDPEYTTQVSGLPTNLTSLQSETEVLRSSDLLVTVIEDLDLLDHAEFNSESSVNLSPVALARGLKDMVIASVSGDPTADPVDPAEAELSRLDDVVEQLREARQIEQVGDTSAVYSIRVTTRDPQLSAQIANSVASSYLESQRQHKIEALRQDQSWLTARTRELQEQLIELGVARETLEIERPFSQEEYATIQAERTVRAQELRSLQQQLAAIEGPAPQEEMAALREEMASVKAVYAELKEAEALRATHDSNVSRIENEILVSEAIYEDFVGQLSRRTQQDEFLAPDARIIERARPDFDPSEPSRSFIAGSTLILALVLGAMVVVLRELTQKRLRTVLEIEEATSLPFFGVVPKIRKPGAPLLSLTTNEARFDPLMMQFARKLRTGVDAAVADRIPSEANAGIVVAGLSTIRGEGQSFALGALARVYSEAGLSVVIIDADPSSTAWERGGSDKDQTQNAKAKPHNKETASALRTTPDPKIRLFSLADQISGTDDRQQERVKALRDALAGMRRRYDVVIVDTPPLLDGVDTVTLLKEADLHIMFLRWNWTQRDLVTTAMRLIEKSRIEPLGVVATQVDLKRGKKYGEPAFDFKMLTRGRRSAASA